jgi:hypothetical protein
VKRFSILATDRNTGAEFEVCQVGSNPGSVVQALRVKRQATSGRNQLAYTSVRIVDHGADVAEIRTTTRPGDFK